jgi:hypothetical protein
LKRHEIKAIISRERQINIDKFFIKIQERTLRDRFKEFAFAYCSPMPHDRYKEFLLIHLLDETLLSKVILLIHCDKVAIEPRYDIVAKIKSKPIENKRGKPVKFRLCFSAR